MATLIKFLDDEMGLLVSESIVQVEEAFNAAAGVPFRLTREKSEEPVYINPSAVAYWHERVKGRQKAYLG